MVTAESQLIVLRLQTAHVCYLYQRVLLMHAPSIAVANDVLCSPSENSLKLLQNHYHRKTTVVSLSVSLFTHQTTVPNLPFPSKKKKQKQKKKKKNQKFSTPSG